jgi:hypothetical protein
VAFNWKQVKWIQGVSYINNHYFMKKSISGKLFAARMDRSYSFGGLKLAAASLILLGTVASCIGDDPEIVSEIKEDFTGVRSISVEGAFLDISYEGNTSGNVVQMDALMRANSNSRAKISYEQKEEKLIIKVTSPAGSIRKSDGYIRLVGPDHVAVDFNVSSGSISVATVKNASTKLRASSGSIQASHVHAPEIILATSSGEILGEDLMGRVNATFSSGKVSLQRLIGNLTAEGSSGNLIVKEQSGKVEAKVSSGKIELERIAELGKLSVSSGNIAASQVGLGSSSEFTASSGGITIQTTSVLNQFNYDLATSSGTVKVGDTQSPGVLKINNGAVHTVKGLVGSGRIHIVN